MKRLLKSVARGCWRLTGPVRRPLGQKFDAAVSRTVAIVVQEQVHAAILPRFDAADHGLALARHEVHAQGLETNLTLDSLVREIGRLQMQIEVLQQMLGDRQAGEDDELVLVGEETRARVG